MDFVMYHHLKKFRAYAKIIGLKAELTGVEGYDHEWRFWELCTQDAMEKFLPGKESGGNLDSSMQKKAPGFSYRGLSEYMPY